MRDEIEDMFNRILADNCTPAVVREIEAGGNPTPLWDALEESGFINALVPEARGGVGLSLQDAVPIADLAGRYAAPVPLAETMMLRGLVARCGYDLPTGMLCFGGPTRTTGDEIVSASIPSGNLATYIAIVHDGEARLLPAGKVEVVPIPYAMECDMHWSFADWEQGIALGCTQSLETLAALTYALQAAGAMQTIFDRTLAYANERIQFGRPIGKFQAIQHQLSIMAEHLFAARMAATVAAYGETPNRLSVAAAKARLGRAIVEVTALAHSIHGAIGFTAEFDLQLYTRRLHLWRQAGGNELVWEHELGNALIHSSSTSSLDLIRQTSEWQMEFAS